MIGWSYFEGFDGALGVRRESQGFTSVCKCWNNQCAHEFNFWCDGDCFVLLCIFQFSQCCCCLRNFDQKYLLSQIFETVFIGNPFDMRLLNLTINFFLLRTFCPHLGIFFFFVVFLTTFRPNFGTDPIMEDQIRRTNNWTYKTKKSKLDRPPGPVAQQI